MNIRVVVVSQPCVGFFSSGCCLWLWDWAWLLDFALEVALDTGHGDGEAGSLCRGGEAAAFGIWGLGLWLFLIASV